MTALKDPAITVNRDDFRELSRLVTLRRDASTAEYLSHELRRAQIVSGPEETAHTVRMGSRVSYRDLEANKVREVVLVMPNETDFAAGLISILTPLGAALLGLSVGQTIAFAAAEGYERSVEVLAIAQPDPVEN